MRATGWKGAVAESAIVLAATKLGVSVARPLSAAERYDLIFDVGSRLLRVQCKSAVRRGDVIVVECHSARRTRDGYLKRCYTLDEVDAIAAYAADLDRCYFLPLDLCAGRSHVQLRLAPARNNQKVGVHWASAFEFEALDWNGVTGP